MDEAVAQALKDDRVIDITTVGRTSGEPRTIEIWFHRLDDAYYITGTPGRPRSWYANLVAEPAFVFHVKESATADLDATARPITETDERTRVFNAILPPLESLVGPGQPTIEQWIAESPLVEVTFA
jgi:deazaflavin-dependent oxidoreductase (nitroreductase family)